MSATYTVRRATSADRSAIRSLQREAAEVREPSMDGGRERAVVQDPAALIVAGHYFVAERQGRVVAAAGWEPHARFPGTAVVRSVFVHGAHSDRAVDTLRTAETNARLEGYDHVLIPATPEALDLYSGRH